MKFARKFAREIFWSEIEESKDSNVADVPSLNPDISSVVPINESHYRYILFIQNKKPPQIDTSMAVDEIATPIIGDDEITDKVKLGGGQYGQVYKAKFRHQTVAVKELYVNPSDLTEDELKRVKLEVDILRFELVTFYILHFVLI